MIDGLEYTYSVVAYDMGVEPTYVTRYIDLGNGHYETKVDTNYSNPGEWANPEGYASIENSKGTTILDRNFVQAYPGVMPTTNLSNVNVVPNPYMARSQFKESEFLRQIRFTNLPESCTIKIFTVNGELVQELEHNNPTSGNAWWDLRTINNQEVAPGLYIFHIHQQNTSAEYVGKFVVVR